MAWTAPKTFVASSALTASELNTYLSDNSQYVKDVLDLHGMTSTGTVQHVLTGGYGFSALTTSDTVPTDTDHGIPFDEADEEYKDVASMHSDSAKQSFICPVTGRYQFDGWVNYQENATGHRSVWIEHAGTTSYNRVRVGAISATSPVQIHTSVTIECTAGDAVRCIARQNSGSTLTISARFQARLVSV